MSWPSVALFAWAGVYAYTALYYGMMRALRTRPEYGRFAGFCGGLCVFSAATALTMESSSPAAALFWQQCQFVGLIPAIAYYVDFCLRLTDGFRPRLVRATYAWAWIGVGAALAGLFFDPAQIDAAYDWGPPSATNRALSMIRPAGAAIVGAGIVVAGYVTARLIAHAKGRPDLRVAAAVGAVTVCAGAFDVATRLLGLTPIHLASHTALLPVFGFSYVLLGRFTNVDAQLEDREKQLVRSYDELRQAQEELVRTEQLAAVGELSAVIAHEVRNPLAILKNAVGGLRRDELRPEDADTLLSILDEETDRLNRLVSDLMAYAKPISPEPGEVDLRPLVMRAVELAAGGAPDIAYIEIELELDSPVAKVEGDETLLRHALINIVDNAIQAMPHGGTLTVACRDAVLDGQRCVAVDFHDTGEGMDTLVRSRARDPFFTTRQQGTGLGLAIVDRVARAHGGRVEIESRHGLGTRVSFVIPVERGSTVPPAS